MKVTTKIAEQIVAGAVEAGATAEMIKRYDLTREDCAYIREEWSTRLAHETAEEAEARREVEDWRAVYSEIESEVRELSHMAA